MRHWPHVGLHGGFSGYHARVWKSCMEFACSSCVCVSRPLCKVLYECNFIKSLSFYFTGTSQFPLHNQQPWESHPVSQTRREEPPGASAHHSEVTDLFLYFYLYSSIKWDFFFPSLFIYLFEILFCHGLLSDLHRRRSMTGSLWQDWQNSPVFLS